MRTGWQARTIEEVCEVVNGGTPKTGVSDYWDGGHQWVTPAEMGKRQSPFIAETERTLTDAGIANSSARPLPPLSVILSSRAPIGHLVINTEPMSFNQGCKGLIPKSNLHYKYLYYFLHANVELLNSLGTGATFKELSGGKLKSVHIPVPPLEEQKRIVTFLDEAFEGISKATANAERNLANAEGLLIATLRFELSAQSENWSETTIGDQFTLQRGFDITKKEQRRGSVPVVSSGGIKSFHDTATAAGPGVVIGRKGSLGTVHYIDEDYWPHDTTLWVKDFKGNSPRFVFHFLKSLDLKALDSGAANPALNRNNVHPIVVRWPTLETQDQIVGRLEKIREQTSVLRNLYTIKLSKLNELKQSLLYKAFSGELTSVDECNLVVEVGKLEVTASPQYTADVLAFAYAKHRTAQRDRTFGRVKGQKVLHLVEAVAGVDLGRDPIKDAAGPNDSAHMRRAEDWAARQNYFAFEARETGGYDFRPGLNFEKTLASAYARLSAHKVAIAKVIDLVVPMDSQEAEVLATVHAAWNNLIIDGVEPTRDAIIAEARENWTASKLEIPVSKFEKAIRFIRQNGIIPDGSAKAVRAKQESLF